MIFKYLKKFSINIKKNDKFLYNLNNNSSFNEAK